MELIIFPSKISVDLHVHFGISTVNVAYQSSTNDMQYLYFYLHVSEMTVYASTRVFTR